MENTNRLKEGIGYGLVQLLGIGVGMISTVFLYGHVLEAYGVVQFFLNTAALLFPLASAGVYALNYRYFPLLENDPARRRGFLPFLLLWGAAGTCIFTLFACILQEPLSSLIGSPAGVIAQHLYVLPPLLLLIVTNYTLAHYAANFGKVAVPAMLNDLLVKLVVPALLLLTLFTSLGIQAVLYALLLYFFTVSLILWWYAGRVGPSRRFPGKTLFSGNKFREMGKYAAYNTVTGLGTAMLGRLDLVMLGLLMPPKAVGAYAIAVTIAGVLEIPFKALSSTVVAMISGLMHRDAYQELGRFSQRSSLSMLALVGGMAGGLWLCAGDLFALMPGRDIPEAARHALLLLLFVKIAEALMGLSGYALMLSKFFRSHFLIVVVLLFTGVSLQLLLIPRLGLAGAATATVLSSLLFHGLATGILYLKTGVQPFQRKMAGIAAVLLLSVIVANIVVPGGLPPLPAMVCKGSLFLGLYSGLIFAFDLAPELLSIARSRFYVLRKRLIFR